MQVSGAVGEVDAAVAERRRRAVVGREYAGIECSIVHWQAVDDHDRLVATADRANAPDDDRRRSSRSAGSTRYVHAGDPSLQRVDDVLELCGGYVHAADRLLR